MTHKTVYYDEYIKREMLLGRMRAIPDYCRMLKDSLEEDEGANDIAAFLDGKPIDIQDSGVVRSIVETAFTRYVRRLLVETYNEVVLEQMEDNNIPAVRVYQSEKQTRNLTTLGMPSDRRYAVWLVHRPMVKGYFVSDHTFENGDFARMPQRDLEKIVSWEKASRDPHFFEYDPNMKLFIAPQKECSPNHHELASYLELSGITGVAEPISVHHWFTGFVQRLRAAVKISDSSID